MEQLMRVVSVWRSAAAWLRRAARALQKFFGPFDPEEPGKPAGPDNRVAVPPGVWYGRATYCLFHPTPLPRSGCVSEGRRSAAAHRQAGTHVRPPL